MKYHTISEFFISLYLKRLFIIIFLYINITLFITYENINYSYIHIQFINRYIKYLFLNNNDLFSLQ